MNVCVKERSKPCPKHRPQPTLRRCFESLSQKLYVPSPPAVAKVPWVGWNLMVLTAYISAPSLTARARQTHQQEVCQATAACGAAGWAQGVQAAKRVAPDHSCGSEAVCIAQAHTTAVRLVDTGTEPHTRQPTSKTARQNPQGAAQQRHTLKYTHTQALTHKLTHSLTCGT